MTEQEAFRALKEGDEVIRYSRGVGAVMLVEAVSSQSLTVGDNKFNRKSGYECGDWLYGSGNPDYLKPVTEESIRHLVAEEVATRLGHKRHYEPIPTDKLKRILAILKEP